MSKPVSPLAIGSFTIGALLLLVAGLFVFGGGQLFNADRVRYVVFFDSSLNGLDIGAPVKMQGVKIGEVTDIALLLDPKSGKIYKPVVIEIDRESLAGTERSDVPGIKSDKEKVVRDQLVEAGFRARLEIQSLLTGLLYVDFDIYPDKAPVYAGLDYQGLQELPGVPTTTEEIRNIAEEVIGKIRDLPLEQMVTDFSDSLREVKKLLKSADVKESTATLKSTLAGMDQTLKTLNGNLDRLLKDTDRTLNNTNDLVVNVNREIKPLLASMEQAMTTANVALKTTQQSMENFGDAVGPESALNETLHSLQQATRSIRDLSDYLQRHPESLLSGKED
ncbi:MlaD family protein [Methylomarinum sp. Ch1-1]|uniref:MlaD family protein n=1 Tax=Methylomarinum roseum TaxID=3067653 RepID=A0AAU7NVK2_9GAMM|nr:MlaD family protein [Methylomarinum sp. Ch1-1]MDP4522893.1 MlaD family protein [Methylomarinum sp. Ch1-1]